MNCQRHLFSIPEDHHYLNCAYFSPLLKSVEKAGKKGINQKRAPWHIKTEGFFKDSDKLRSLFARLINVENENSIALLPSTSYGMATVANNLPERSEGTIVVVGEQYPSNIYSWTRYCKKTGCRIKMVKAPKEFEQRGRKWNECILDAIDSNTLMVAIPNIHWTDGTLFDLKAIGEKVHEVDAYFVVDGTQSVGALSFDVQELKPDVLICAGYKWLMGPYSIALGYFGERFADGIPLEEGWLGRKNSENFAELANYTDEYQAGAIRYDVGERSNFILVPMMIKAVEQIIEWEPANIQNYCRLLTRHLTAELVNCGYKIEDSAWRAHHLFGIYLPEYIHADNLRQELEKNNIYVSVRGSALRISPHVYNNKKDIAALHDVFCKLCKE
jgi:selenocysteine lyase/cysteine desulfurase